MELAALMVLTPDVAEARRFYGEVLGFRLLSETADFLEFAGVDAPLHVFRCEAEAPPLAHGAQAASVFVFKVASLDTAMAVLKAKGVKFLHETPGSNAFGRYAAFHAPGGLIHEIFEPVRP